MNSLKRWRTHGAKFGGKSWLAFACALQLLLSSVAAEAADQSNSPATATAKPAAPVYELKAYLKGFPDGTFRPDAPITRGVTAVIVASLFHVPEMMDAKTFTDLVLNHSAKNGIDALSRGGLMDGYPDGSFRPEQFLTRSEAAVLIDRVLNKTGKEGVGFSDVKTDFWAGAAIRRLQTAGMVDGYEGGTFHPDAIVTRAEIAAILNRFLSREPLTAQAPQWSDVPKTHWAFGIIQAASIDHN